MIPMHNKKAIAIHGKKIKMATGYEITKTVY
jgi:hypothetical protein